MDLPSSYVSWPSPLPRHSRKNTLSSCESAIFSATKYSSAPPRRPPCGTSAHPPSGTSQQMNRLQEQERAVERCKALKQIAQIVPHRVDRLYYIRGSQVPVQAKYNVGNATLRRLQTWGDNQQAGTAQVDRKGLICEDSEGNEPLRNCESRAAEADRPDNDNKKYCPPLMLVFMTETTEESPEDRKGVNLHQSFEQTYHILRCGVQSLVRCVEQGPKYWDAWRGSSQVELLVGMSGCAESGQQSNGESAQQDKSVNSPSPGDDSPVDASDPECLNQISFNSVINNSVGGTVKQQ
ncbi:uncharacterized protein LOC144594689 [Rhinoraja longicauda]